MSLEKVPAVCIENIKYNQKHFSMFSIHMLFLSQTNKLHGLLMLPGKATFVSCSIISLGLSF